MKTCANLLLLLWLPASGACAQTDTVYYTEEDRAVFDRYLALMEDKDSLPFDSLILHTASFFLGTPYVAATLEVEPEGLVVNLRELDCSTFVENVIALSHTLAAGEPTFDKYCARLRRLRYRRDKIGGYADRLHYTSDWLYENSARGLVKYRGKDETGGEPYVFDLYFMSSHPDSYRQLKADSTLIPRIREAERRVSGRSPFYNLIPQDAIDSLATRIQSGDMVAFVTSIDGLDISHVGIITRQGGTLSFLHASSQAMKVIVNPAPLKEYVEKSRTCPGIMLAQPLPPSLE
jgi:hypothetical protein